MRVLLICLAVALVGVAAALPPLQPNTVLLERGDDGSASATAGKGPLKPMVDTNFPDRQAVGVTVLRATHHTDVVHVDQDTTAQKTEEKKDDASASTEKKDDAPAAPSGDSAQTAAKAGANGGEQKPDESAKPDEKETKDAGSDDKNVEKSPLVGSNGKDGSFVEEDGDAAVKESNEDGSGSDGSMSESDSMSDSESESESESESGEEPSESSEESESASAVSESSEDGSSQESSDSVMQSSQEGKSGDSLVVARTAAPGVRLQVANIVGEAPRTMLTDRQVDTVAKNVIRGAARDTDCPGQNCEFVKMCNGKICPEWLKHMEEGLEEPAEQEPENVTEEGADDEGKVLRVDKVGAPGEAAEPAKEE